nr:MAG TPA: hypothetical protein [Caudoviricetes sp.]
MFCIAQNDFEPCYIVTSGTLKQFKLYFDKCIDFTKKQLKISFKLSYMIEFLVDKFSIFTLAYIIFSQAPIVNKFQWARFLK